jgi:hypothetical protein
MAVPRHSGRCAVARRASRHRQARARRAPDQPKCLGGRGSPCGTSPVMASSGGRRHLEEVKSDAIGLPMPTSIALKPQECVPQAGRQQFPCVASQPSSSHPSSILGVCATASACGAVAVMLPDCAAEEACTGATPIAIAKPRTSKANNTRIWNSDWLMLELFAQDSHPSLTEIKRSAFRPRLWDEYENESVHPGLAPDCAVSGQPRAFYTSATCRTLKNDTVLASCGGGQRAAVGRVYSKQRMSCGCTCSTTISTPPDPEEGCDGGRLQSSVYDRLKPGGYYVIVDHAAAAGTGTNDAQSLHRIEPASVREEVAAAGFVFEAESTILTNKDDQHSLKVFDPSIKGATDRFAYRFVKP